MDKVGENSVGNDGKVSSLKLTVNSPEGDLPLLEKTTRRLKEELQEDSLLDIERIELDRPEDKEIPEGARCDLLTIGVLILRIVESSGALKPLVNKLQKWLDNRNHDDGKSQTVDATSLTTITLEDNGDKLTITGESYESQKQLIDLWISRHTQK